jgi:hypothetical protein
MAKRKRLEGASQRWVGDAESVWTGMADWRAAHPKATFSEIEAALDERLNQVRARELSYFSRRTDHATFRRLALAETHRRGVGTAGTVVAVMDDADWLQGFIDFHRHDAIRVLDFPHAVEYLTRAGHEAHGPGTAATSEWRARQAHALKHHGPAATRSSRPGRPFTSPLAAGSQHPQDHHRRPPHQGSPLEPSLPHPPACGPCRKLSRTPVD